MQTNTIAGSTTLLGLIGISFATPLSGEVLIGAFAGSVVYMLNSSNILQPKRSIFGFLSFFLGVAGHSSLSGFAWINECIAAAIISTVSIYALIALNEFGKSGKIAQSISTLINRLIGGKNE